MKIDPLTAHDSYGARRDGQHDDLVLAVAVAEWVWERGGGGAPMGERKQSRYLNQSGSVLAGGWRDAR